ncbi:MAG: LamG-like jellyroll fold domain-containing protein, partial [Bacteroidota bacterium]
TTTYTVTAYNTGTCFNQQTQTITVNQNPAVTVSPSNTTSCDGSIASFSVTATGAGLTYVWQKSTNSGGNWTALSDDANTSGSTTATLNLSNLASGMNGYLYRAVVTGTCGSPATSSSATLTLAAPGAPTVTISTSPSTTVCPATSVTFTASGTLAGVSPTYQWFKNGFNQGAASASPTFTTSTLSNGDKISVVMTSSSSCADPSTATSDETTITVTPNSPTASVSISSVPVVVCPATSVTFTATPTNGGTPSYAWKVDGVANGQTGSTWTTSSLTAGQIVTVTMATSLACPATPTTTSSGITVTAVPTAPTASVNTPSVCVGSAANYTAAYTNLGSSPSYQWYKNNSPVGTSATYTDASPAVNDQIKVAVTRGESCGSTTTSSVFTFTEFATGPAFTLSPSTDPTICVGSSQALTGPTSGAGNAIKSLGTVGGAGGAVNYINLPSGFHNNFTSAFTFEGYVRVTSLSHYHDVFTIGNNPGGALTDGYYCMLRINATGAVLIQDKSNTGTVDMTVPSFTVGAGTLYHMAVTFDGTNMKFYVDGVLKYTVASTRKMSDYNNAAWNNGNSLGRSLYTPTDGQNYFEGTMDEVRFWKTARTEAQLLANKSNSIAVPNANLVAYYKFDEPTTTNSASTNAYVVTSATGSNDASLYSTYYTPSPAPYITSPVTNFNSFSYAWTAGASPTVLGTAVTYTPSPTSTTTYNLLVTNTVSGCTTNATRTVNVNQNLSISAQPSNTFICTGGTGTFTVGTTGGGTLTHNWQYSTNSGSTWFNASGAPYSNNTTATLTITSPSASLNGYQYRDQINGCGSAVTPLNSNAATLNTGVSAFTTQPVASSICTGSNAQFTTAVFGTGLTYQWQVNPGPGFVNVTDGALYSGGTTATLNVTTPPTSMTGYQYRVLVNGTCGNLTSNAVGLEVTDGGAASVTISTPNTSVCAGTSVTFTAVSGLQGSSPSYQWKINGTNAGSPTSSATFTRTNLADGNSVSVQLTSSSSCASPSVVSSNSILMEVTPTGAAPAVSLASSPATVCPGLPVTFTATPDNGGATPTYTWFVNSNPIANTGATYTTSSLVAGNTVYVEMHSSATCATPANVTSSTITVTPTAATATAAITNTAACSGGSATYSASGTNLGTPAYSWKKNNISVSGSGSTYTDNSPALGDVISVTVTPSLSCSSPVTATYTLDALTPAPAASITGNSTICLGTSVTLTGPTGGAGNMLSFGSQGNGTNYVVLPNITSTLTGGFTWEGYVKGGSTNYVNIFSFGSTFGDAAINDLYFTLRMESSGSLSFASSISSLNQPAFRTISNNTWYHMAVTLDGTNLKFYLNGVLMNTFTSTAHLSSLAGRTNPWNFLGHPLYADFTGEPDFKGSMDEVRIWNVARSATQISSSYAAPVSNTSTGLVAYYKMDELSTYSGTTVSSATGSNNATLSANFLTNNAVPFITSTVSTFNVYTYSWSPSAGLTPNATSSAVTAIPGANTTYTLTVTANGGCFNTASKTVTVLGDGGPAPTVSVAAGNICSGQTVSFTATALNAGTPRYQWNKNGVNVGQNFSVYSYPNPAEGDLVYVTIYPTAGCPVPVSSSVFTVESVNQSPVATITASATTVHEGEPITFSVPSGAGNMLAFNSTATNSNYVVLPNMLSAMNHGFTWEGWVKSDLSDYAQVFAFGSTNSAAAVDGNYFSLSISTAGKLSTQSSVAALVHADFYTLAAPTALNHIAATLDGANLKVYVNGSLVSTFAAGAVPASFAGAANPWNYLGHALFGDANVPPTFKGRMDEVRIWSVARSASQLSANYNKTISSTSTGLLAYYKFDNATTFTGTTVTSATGSNNATLSANFVTNTPTPYVTSSVTGFNASTYFWAGSGSTGNTSTFTVRPLGTGYVSVQVTSSAGCVTSGAVAITVIPACKFTGAVSSDWDNAANWASGAVPTVLDSVYIPQGTSRNAVLTGSSSVRAMYINGTMEIASGGSLDLKGNLTGGGSVTGAGSFNMSGTAAQYVVGTPNVTAFTVSNSNNVTLTQGLNVNGKLLVSSGALNVNNKRLTLNAGGYLGSVQTGTLLNAATTSVKTYLDPAVRRNGGSWHFVAPTVTGQTVLTWQVNNPYWSESFNSGTAGNASVYLFDPTDVSANSLNGYVRPTAASQPAPVGTGAYVWFGGQFFVAGANTMATGTPMLGNFTYSGLKYCASGCAGSSASSGFNLVGNPYAASINWDSPSWTKTNIGAAIYIWNPATSSYTSYVTGIGGVNGGTSTIAKGQAFFVAATSASPVLAVTPSVLATNQASVIRSSATGNLRFSLLAQVYTDEMLLVRNESGVTELNNSKDAVKLFGSNLNGGFASNGRVYAIGQRSINAGDTVNLHIASKVNNVPVLKLTSKEGFEDLDIFLYDRLTGSHQLVEVGTVMPVNNSGDRYALVFTNAVTAVNPNASVKLNLYPNPANDVLYMEGLNRDSAHKLTMTDMLGHNFIVVANEVAGRHSIDLSGLAPGVYVLKVNGRGYQVVKK